MEAVVVAEVRRLMEEVRPASTTGVQPFKGHSKEVAVKGLPREAGVATIIVVVVVVVAVVFVVEVMAEFTAAAKAKMAAKFVDLMQMS